MPKDTYRLTPTQSLTVITRSPDFVVEAEYAPGGSPPPEHLHPQQDERFEVLSGSVSALLAGVEQTVLTGSALDVPVGTPHTFWNPGDVPARVRWTTSPAGRTEEWFATVDRLIATDALATDGLAALQEFADTFVLAGGPQPG